MDNFRYELAAAGAAELLLELELDLAEESELDELEVLELDESEDEEEPLDSPFFADPLDEPLLAVAFDAMLHGVGLYRAVRDEQGKVVDFEVRHLNRQAREMQRAMTEVGVGSSFLETFPRVEMLQLAEKGRFVHGMKVLFAARFSIGLAGANPVGISG